MPLKKTAAIFFILVHLCSSTCYSFFFNYFIQLSDTQLVQQLDTDNYKDADLVEIAMPLHMPYIINSNGYERYDGEIELNGAHYNYVKRKVSNDTLYILCLPNIQKAQVCAAKNDYTKQLSDIQSPKKSNESTAKKSLVLQEYNIHCIQFFHQTQRKS